jgi:hypothetical protein
MLKLPPDEEKYALVVRIGETTRMNGAMTEQQMLCPPPEKGSGL